MPGIPPDIMFSLDGCVEAGDMTADVHAYITLIDHDIIEWYEGLRGQNFIQLLNASARQRMAAWRESADLDDRAAVTWIGLNELPRTLTDSARHCLSEAVKLRGTSVEDVAALLANDAFLADNAAPFLPNLNEITMRARDDIRLMGKAAFSEGRHLVDDLHRRIGERRMQLIVAGQMSEVGTSRRPERRSVRKARRKPLVKAMDLLSKIGGRQTAHAFIVGDDVIVTGRKFNFKVRKGVVTSNGHGALNLTVTDRDNIELVDLCFYFENMPAPDQLAALILHVKAGNEEEIVRTGNTIRTYQEGMTHERIRELREERKHRNVQAYGTTVDVTRALETDRGPAAMMSRHVDMVLFGGRLGSSEFYNQHHDLFVPRVASRIVDIAMSSRAGQFLVQHAPEAARLVSLPRPSRTDAVTPEVVDTNILEQIQFQVPARRSVTI